MIKQILTAISFAFIGLTSFAQNDDTTTYGGKVSVINGMGEYSTIPYSCIGCAKYTGQQIYDALYLTATKLSNELYTPTSLVPIRSDMVMLKTDDYYWYDDSRLVQNLSVIYTELTYTALSKGGEYKTYKYNTIYFRHNGVVKDMYDELMLNQLEYDSESKSADRTLKAENNDGSISLLAMKSNAGNPMIGVVSSLGYVDNTTSIKYIFKDGSYFYVNSNNESPSYKGVSAFPWFTYEQKKTIERSDLSRIVIRNFSKTLDFTVPKNQGDYLKQAIKLF